MTPGFSKNTACRSTPADSPLPSIKRISPLLRERKRAAKRNNNEPIGRRTMRGNEG